MSDLISRAAAIDAIESHIRLGDELYPLTRTDEILNYAFEVAASCIYNAPSVEVTLCHLDSPCEYQNADIEMPSAQPGTPPYVAEIESEYKKWAGMPHINKPLAKALYEVWKKHDREDVSRNGRSDKP